MRYYFCKLLPPCPTVMQDITVAELRLTQEYALYWRGMPERGYAVGFGPVVDPAGRFGMGLLELPEDVDPASLTGEDPVIKAQLASAPKCFPWPGQRCVRERRKWRPDRAGDLAVREV